MIGRVKSAAIIGIEAEPIDVEVRIRRGPNCFTIIGLGDTAVRESRDRITSALRHQGFAIPNQILVNLAPAELKKEGSGFDLPMAVAILLASGQIDPRSVEGAFFLGELSLDGSLKGVRGALSIALAARSGGAEALWLPEANAQEASLVSQLNCYGVSSISELVASLRAFNETGINRPPTRRLEERVDPVKKISLDQVIGQSGAKRALAIAAAGGHNILFVGPPGCGKSMLAERFHLLVQAPTPQETLEIVQIHSLSGEAVTPFLQGARPIRSPHYGVSETAMIGGGSGRNLVAGEVSLAHNGVLFLDELPEFRREAIESMRIPLETGRVDIARSRARRSFPAKFTLVAAMNPCPCGRAMSGSEAESSGQECRCSLRDIKKYLGRISLPLLDRIDLQIVVYPAPIVSVAPLTPSVPRQEDIMLDEKSTEQCLQQSVARAKRYQRQHGRNGNSSLELSAALKGLADQDNSLRLLDLAVKKQGLSARGLVRTLRVSRTLADMEEAELVQTRHLAEALQYRAVDRYFAKLTAGY